MGESGPADSGWYEMLGSLWLRTRLFISSYAAMLAIFAFRSNSGQARVLYSAAALLVLIDAWRLTYGQRRKTLRPHLLTDLRDKGSEVSGYLATYLLPFLSGPPADWWEAGAYAVYFLVAWVVFLNSDLLFINPTLYLLRWRVAQGTRADGREVVVLTRNFSALHTQFDAAQLGSDLVHVEK